MAKSSRSASECSGAQFVGSIICSPCFLSTPPDVDINFRYSEIKVKLDFG